MNNDKHRGRFFHDIPILIIDQEPNNISLEVKTLILSQLLITQQYQCPRLLPLSIDNISFLFVHHVFTKKQFVKSLFQSWQKLFWLDGWSIYNFHSIQFYLLMVAIIGDNQTWYFSIFNENIIAISIAVCLDIFAFEYWENIENFICFFCWNCISTEIDFELQ